MKLTEETDKLLRICFVKCYDKPNYIDLRFGLPFMPGELPVRIYLETDKFIEFVKELLVKQNITPLRLIHTRGTPGLHGSFSIKDGKRLIKIFEEMFNREFPLGKQA